MYYKKKIFLKLFAAIIFLIAMTPPSKGMAIARKAKSTLTPIEMNIGDTLEYTLRNGQTRTMVLEETDAGVIITNLDTLKTERKHGATLYHFTCKVVIDGHPMTMERYVGSQESFYEPYVINGMRIWFDGVAAIFNNGIVNEEHGECKPNKDARFAITDMTDRICPDELYCFYDNKENFIDISFCYNGDDCWMGAYNGLEAHGGLDIDQPKGSPNYTPFTIDDHYLFNSLSKGDENNRWRGIHKWDNGDVWVIQNAHMLNLLIPEHVPIKAGIHYADAASVHLGDNEHAHYIFRVKSMENEKEILLDPWIILWQNFEDNRKRNKEIKADISPLYPGKTNAPFQFSSRGSNSGMNGQKLSYYWTFGDGGFSVEENPLYTFVNAGIFPVTLVVDDGAHKASFTQHITIDGNNSNKPSLILAAKEEPSFRIRPVMAMDVYGSPVKVIPHSLFFLARPTRPRPDEQILVLFNPGGGTLPKVMLPKIVYSKGSEWLTVKTIGKNNDQELIVTVDGTGLSTGRYTSMVQVECPGVINSIQYFLVELSIPTYPPTHREMSNEKQEIIDNEDIRPDRFYCTPYFWVGPHFKRWKENGYKNFYLTNGGRAVKGEFARFRPDLEAASYEVSFTKETPFDPQRRAMDGEEKMPVNNVLNPVPSFTVRVHSKTGDKIIQVEPTKSSVIGVFEFSEGMDGYVDILSEGSIGQVIIDAIIFKKLK